MNSDQNNQSSPESGEGINEDMSISALLDDDISSTDFTILSAQFSANPALMGALKTQQYVRDALAGFGSPDYLYTERIMAFIARSVAKK
jgi:hypothetical protein